MARAESKNEPGGDRTVARNKRARFDYELGDSYEAGLSLIGSEVRALREHGANLTEAWVDVDARGEAWVKGMRIPPLKHAFAGHEEKRARKLLLHGWELERLKAATERQGMTIIATRCYFKHNRAKLEIAVAKGKRKYDKRQALKAREADREARVAIRRGRDE